MIKNKIVEALNTEVKQLVYTALLNNKKVLATNNKRTAPNSFITLDDYYTIGIEPKDDSYFDFEILPLEKMLDKEDLQMICNYTVKNGIEKAEKAYNQSFKNISIQYTLQDILILGGITIWILIHCMNFVRCTKRIAKIES